MLKCFSCSSCGALLTFDGGDVVPIGCCPTTAIDLDGVKAC